MSLPRADAVYLYLAHAEPVLPIIMSILARISKQYCLKVIFVSRSNGSTKNNDKQNTTQLKPKGTTNGPTNGTTMAQNTYRTCGRTNIIRSLLVNAANEDGRDIRGYIAPGIGPVTLKDDPRFTVLKVFSDAEVQTSITQLRKEFGITHNGNTHSFGRRGNTPAFCRGGQPSTNNDSKAVMDEIIKYSDATVSKSCLYSHQIALAVV